MGRKPDAGQSDAVCAVVPGLLPGMAIGYGANNQAAANAAHCAGCLANSFVTLPVVSSWIESVLAASQASMLAVAHDQAAAVEAAWVTAEIAGLSKA